MIDTMMRISSTLDLRGHPDLADRMDRLAMPYRWEGSEDSAKSIVEHGYDPQEAIFTYIDEYSDRFQDDLSEDARAQLEAFSEEIGLPHELNTYGRGGKRWDRYVDRLAELWFQEHPRETLLWLAHQPQSAMEFGGDPEELYERNLLRYSPPPGHEPDEFLRDYAYGYATKVKLPEGHDRIPAEWFSLVSPEEWQQHKDDTGHWAAADHGHMERNARVVETNEFRTVRLQREGRTFDVRVTEARIDEVMREAGIDPLRVRLYATPHSREEFAHVAAIDRLAVSCEPSPPEVVEVVQGDTGFVDQISRMHQDRARMAFRFPSDPNPRRTRDDRPRPVYRGHGDFVRIPRHEGSGSGRILT